jgi:YfiH family protein
MAWQYHSAEVVRADGRGVVTPGLEFERCDGLWTDEPGRAVMLLTADCLPVAIARADGRRLAVLHAGWRGLVAGIVERGAEAVRGRAVAAVGPGAGPCCYEVGEDVAGILREGFGEDVVRHGRADLWLAARRALEAAGVTDVEVAGECSICCGERYFSHRRDRGTTGRQGIVGVLGA